MNLGFSSLECRIALDGLMVAVLALWVPFWSEMNFLKRKAFYGVILFTSLLLLGDIAICLIGRLNSVFRYWTCITEKMYLVKFALCINLSFLVLIISIIYLPGKLWEATIHYIRSTLFVCRRMVVGLERFIEAFKKDMSK